MPIAIFLSIWLYEVSVLQIVLEFSLATGISIYIIILSVMSPCVPFLGPLGSALSIISWILAQTMFMRVRCLGKMRFFFKNIYFKYLKEIFINCFINKWLRVYKDLVKKPFLF
jgi:hypothetical protein